MLPRTLLSAILALSGCVAQTSGPAGEIDTIKPEDGKADSSALAVFLDFEWDGELVTDSSWNAEQTIEDQLLYTIGQLNGENGVGRLDRLVLSDIQTERQADGRTLIAYHAKMPVAWSRRDNIPATYTLQMPRDVSFSGQESFTAKYKDSCVDWSAHDVTAGIMWYYWRPAASGCNVAAEDIIEMEAVVSPSAIQTTGRFPEFDRIWADNEFRAVVIFGKNEDGATSNSDAGISAFNTFVSSIRRELARYTLTTTPATIPQSPGVALPDVQLDATMPDGRRIQVVALLVDGVRTAPASFDRRYEQLTGRADFISYNGHSGLGANIRALARKGRWETGQYVVVHMNGCDTYAYVDSALFDAHRAVNPDDPTGTRYIDIIMNAMPSFFHSNAPNAVKIIQALVNRDDPQTFEQIFRSIDPSQVILVSGEQDNTYQPGPPPPPPSGWEGLSANGTVTRGQESRWETPSLPAGRYRFEMTGTSDADLYVRTGLAPTSTSFDCRPYKSSSNESCEVTLTSPAVLHVMVRGYSASSTYQLAGRAL